MEFNLMEKMFLYREKASLAFSILIGALYCVGLTFLSPVGQSLSTILFILCLCFLFYSNTKRINFDFPSHIIFQIALLNISIALTAQIIHSPVDFFWVQDSILSHLPISLKYTAFLKGQASVHDTFTGLYDISGKNTHFVTGAFLAILGTNTFATIMAQLFFKLITAVCIYFICDILLNRKIGFIAVQIYSFCPTIFFYNLVLYKESATHAFLALTILLSLKIFLKQKYSLIFPLALILFLMSMERFYIAYLSIVMIFLFTLHTLLTKKNLRYALLTIVALILIACGIYRSEIAEIFFKGVQKVNDLRLEHSRFSDVMNQYNYQIPYIAAFFKILFSPYFTPNKFTIFFNFSTLLIWGSFPNQVIILTSVIGFFKLSKKSIYHIYLWAPFILFLLFAAYVSPWSGRLRDSYYPLIACYAAYFLATNKYFQKYFDVN